MPDRPQQPVDVEAWAMEARKAKDEDGLQHILLRAVSPHTKQQADERMIALMETHNDLMDTYATRVSDTWQEALHAHTLQTWWVTMQGATQEAACQCKHRKGKLFIDSMAATLLYWEALRLPLVEFQKQRHNDMAALVERKALYVAQRTDQVNAQIAVIQLGTKILQKLTKYATDCERIAVQMKQNLLNEAVRQEQSRSLSYRSMHVAWGKRQRETGHNDQPSKKQRTEPTKDTAIVCLTSSQHHEEEQTEATWLCGEGTWE
jgi:hypothetical protein